MHTRSIFVLGLVLLFACQSTSVKKPTELQGQKPHDLANTVIAYSVIDLESGEVMAEKNSTVLFPPASVAKLFTAAYALDVLSHDFRFRTSIVKSGNNIFLVGRGDPTLTIRDLFQLANQVIDSGLKEIDHFFYDDFYIPSLETIDEEIHPSAPYNSGVSALNVEFNQSFVQFDRAADGSFTATPILTLPVIQEDLNRISSFYEGTRSRLSRVPIRKGSLYTAELFAKIFRTLGGTISEPRQGQAPAKAKVISTHSSEPLLKIIAAMFEYSDNLYAETMGLVASRVRAKKPVSLRDSSFNMQKWVKAKFALGDLKLVNHSGLTVETKVSPQDLTKFLRAIDKKSWSKYRLRTLLGSYGWQWKKTARFLHPESVFPIFVKTGSLDFVSNLAGYIYTTSGRTLAFALMTSDLKQRQQTRSISLEEIAKLNSSWVEVVSPLQQEMLNGWVAKKE